MPYGCPQTCWYPYLSATAWQRFGSGAAVLEHEQCCCLPIASLQMTFADSGYACYNPRMAIVIKKMFLLCDNSWREQAGLR